MWRRLAEVQTEHQNGEERGYKWLWTWNGCWCQMGWSEYFKNWDFHAQPSGFDREWSEKEKISSERQLCGRKCLVDVRGQRRMGRLVRDDRKATVTQITTRYEPRYTEYHLWTHNTSNPEADGYSSRRPHRVPLLSLRTENGGYNLHRLIGKTLPGLMSLDFCCGIQMVGSGFDVKNMKAWIHPALSQRCKLMVVV